MRFTIPMTGIWHINFRAFRFEVGDIFPATLLPHGDHQLSEGDVLIAAAQSVGRVSHLGPPELEVPQDGIPR